MHTHNHKKDKYSVISAILATLKKEYPYISLTLKRGIVRFFSP